MKWQYRKAVHGEGTGNKAKYPASDAQPTLTVAWNTVKLKTIANSFKITGFNCSDNAEMTTDAEIIGCTSYQYELRRVRTV
jgi:hypothetical protein